MYKKYFLPLFFFAVFFLILIFALHPLTLAQGAWQGPAVGLFVIVSLGAYLLLGLRARDNPSTKIIIILGYVMGLLWITEILAGNLDLHLHGAFLDIFYFTPIFLVLVVNIFVGALVAVQQQNFSAGVRAGTQSGLLSGLLALGTLAALIVFTLPIQVSNPQNIDQFLRSHTADLAAFISQDYIFAGASHLWIGLLGGLISGGFGAALGKYFIHRRNRPKSISN